MNSHFIILKLNAFYLLFSEFTKSNPVLSGLMGLWGIAIISFFTKSIPSSLWRFIVRHSTIRVTLNNSNLSYSKILGWLENEGHTKRVRSLRIGGMRMYENDTTDLRAGFGSHYFLIGLRPFKLTRQIDDSSKSYTRPNEVVELVTIGRSRKPIEKIISEAIPKTNKEDFSEIYMWQKDYWKQTVTQPARKIDSIIIKKIALEEIICHLNKFTSSQTWYNERGIPYRTGMCLYGPPGTGKTSLVKALCSYLKRDLYVLSLVGMNDISLQQAFLEVPKDALVLIEDIDTFSVSKKRGESSNYQNENSDNDDDSSALTLSGLLNAIDGAANSDGRILILSTNHVEKLDAALLRSGRIDHFVNLPYLDDETARLAFYLFFPNYSLPTRIDLKKNVSPADFQNYVLKNRDEPDVVLASICAPPCPHLVVPIPHLAKLEEPAET